MGRYQKKHRSIVFLFFCANPNLPTLPAVIMLYSFLQLTNHFFTKEKEMNIWENTVLTDKGKALQAKLLQGQTLKISRVTTGSKKIPIVDLRQQTDG